MASLVRISFRGAKARPLGPGVSRIRHRPASTDYGSKQSGHEQGINESNPKKHLEHPGPEPPATKADNGHAPNSGAKEGASPKIHQPRSAKEEQSDEVRKHNEEMRHRAEKTANQLGEKDNKVDKKFWQGDVGDMQNKNA